VSPVGNSNAAPRHAPTGSSQILRTEFTLMGSVAISCSRPFNDHTGVSVIDYVNPLRIALAVSFQEVVHSALTEEAEVAEASDSEGRTEWTPIRMRL
jgi:hypothetical protein